MPNPSVPFYSTDPTLQANYLQLQQREALARALMQEGMTPISTSGREVGGVGYNISPMEGLAKLLQAYTGSQTLNDTLAQEGQLQADQFRNIYGMMGGGQQSTQDTTPQASPQARAMADILRGGSDQQVPINADIPPELNPPMRRNVGPTVDRAALMASNPAPSAPLGGAPVSGQQSTGSGPLNPGGVNPALAAYAFSMDPSGYLRTVIGQQAPTDFQKVAAASGLQPGTPEYQAAMRDYVGKQNYIAPVPIRAGGGVQDQRTGQITTMPAAPPSGFINQQQPDGSWRAVPVKNGTLANAYATYATEAGKAPFAMVSGFDDKSGKPYSNYAGNSLRPPPFPSLPAFPGDGSGQPQSQQPPQSATQISSTPRRAATSAPDAQAASNAQGYTTDSLKILKDELAKTANPDDRAALQREIARVQSALTPGDRRAVIAAQVEHQFDWNAKPPGIQTGPSLGAPAGATNAQSELSDAWKSQLAAHQTAQTNISLLQSIKQLAPSAVTGAENDRRSYLVRLGALAGVPGMDEKASATDLLNKYASQIVQGLSAKGMNTDAARDLVTAGSPNSKMQSAAIQDAADSLISREQMAQARTRALQPYANKRDAEGFQNAAASFDSNADPRLWQMKGMTPQQLQAYTAKLTPTDAQALIQKYQTAKQAGWLK